MLKSDLRAQSAFESIVVKKETSPDGTMRANNFQRRRAMVLPMVRRLEVEFMGKQSDMLRLNLLGKKEDSATVEEKRLMVEEGTFSSFVIIHLLNIH